MYMGHVIFHTEATFEIVVQGKCNFEFEACVGASVSYGQHYSCLSVLTMSFLLFFFFIPVDY